MEQKNTQKVVRVGAYMREADVDRTEIVNGLRLFHLKEPMYVPYRKKEYAELWENECSDVYYENVDSDTSSFKALGDALRPDIL